MPRPMVITAVRVNAGFLRSVRTANERSWRIMAGSVVGRLLGDAYGGRTNAGDRNMLPSSALRERPDRSHRATVGTAVRYRTVSLARIAPARRPLPRTFASSCVNLIVARPAPRPTPRFTLPFRSPDVPSDRT